MHRLAQRVWTSPTATTWGSLFVRLAGAVIILPLVLVRLPVAEVAIWQLFASLYALTLLLDFGLSPTFSRLYAYGRGGASIAAMKEIRRAAPSSPTPAAEDEVWGVQARVFGTQRWLATRLSLGLAAVLAVGGSIALHTPISQVADQPKAWIAWALVVATSGAGFLGNTYAAALQGLNSIASLRRWETATGLAQIITSLAALYAGAGLLGLTATFQFWVGFSAWRNRRLLRELHPRLFAFEHRYDADVARALWPAAWRSGVGVLASHGVIQFSGVAYSQVAPARDVAAYLLALRVMTMVSQFAQAPFYSKLPELGRMLAQGSKAELLASAREGMLRAHWVFALGAGLAAWFAQPALVLIGSQTTFVSSSVWGLMAIAFFLERFGAMHMQLYSLTNHILWHIANGVTGLAMLLGAMVLYPHFGLHALPAAMLAAYAMFYVPIAAGRSRSAFGIRLLPFETAVSVPAFAALLIAVSVAAWIRTS